MKRITLTRGQFTIVDDEDFERFGKLKWQADRMGLNEMRDKLRMMALVEGSSVHECKVEERP